MNPFGALFIIGTLGLGYWLWKDAQDAGPKPEPGKPPLATCPISYDMIAGFAKEKGFAVWYVEKQKVSSWVKPKPAFANDSKARAWSEVDCGFFAWNGISWIPDLKTDIEFAKAQGIEF